MKANPILTNFSSGELSSRIDGRVDLQQYYSGCKTLENMVVDSLGVAWRRPGTYEVVEVKTSSKKVRMVDYEKDASTYYVCEFGDQYIRFYRNHAQIQSGGSPYELVSPYLEADLFQLKIKQKEGDLYITHPSYAPRKLVCTSDTSWSLTTPTFMGFDDTTAKTITGATQASPVVITSTAHGFVNGDVVLIKGVVGMYEINAGAYVVAGAVANSFQLSGINGTGYHTYISGGTVAKRAAIFAATGKYPSCLCFFEGRLFFGLNRTIYGSKSGDYTDFSLGTNDGDGLEYGIPTKDTMLWLSAKSDIHIGMTGSEYHLSGGAAPLTPSNVMLRHLSRYGSANIQGEDVNESILFVQKGARRLREYVYNADVDTFVSPDRTILADHVTGTGVTVTALQQDPNTVVWLVRSDGVLVGLTFDQLNQIVAWHRHVTDGVVESIAIIPGTAEDEIWISVARTVNGATKRYIEYFKPRDWGTDQDDCFFVDCGKTYDGGAAVTITGATAADPVVITATAHGFANDDLVRIVGVVGMTQLNRSVYMVKNKTADTFQLYIEDGTDAIDGTGFTAYTSGGTVEKVYKTLTGLSHLEGKTVSILSDGAVLPDEVVTAGSITCDRHGNKVHVGLPYTSTLQTMRLEAGSADGTAQGKIKRIIRLVIRFIKTLGAKTGPDENHLSVVPFRLNTDDMDEATALWDGDKDVMPFFGYWGKDAYIFIVQDQPLPLGVIAIMPEVNTNG